MKKRSQSVSRCITQVMSNPSINNTQKLTTSPSQRVRHGGGLKTIAFDFQTEGRGQNVL
jgi:hypothetical protein